MTFRQLNSEDHQAVMKFLLDEPGFNIFVIGDIENHGYHAKHQTIWGIIDDQGAVYGVLLRFYDSYIPYAYKHEVLEKFAPLVSLGARILSGKKEIIDKMKDYLSEEIAEENVEHFARLTELRDKGPAVKISRRHGSRIKRASLADVDRLLELRSQIAEFGSLPLNRESVVNKLQTGSGRVYYLEDEQGQMVSTAATSAESSTLAMIVGVATLPGYRRQGLATGCLYRLCLDLLSEGKTPCLFYNNPEAGQIYQQLGFEDIGKWTILKLTSSPSRMF